MPRLPRVNSRKVINALLRADFYIHHQTGSHINLRHFIKKYLHIVVPVRKENLAPKTLKSIIVQTELTIDDFIKLL